MRIVPEDSYPSASYLERCAHNTRRSRNDSAVFPRFTMHHAGVEAFGDEYPFELVWPRKELKENS